jgi:hypothetical protein
LGEIKNEPLEELLEELLELELDPPEAASVSRKCIYLST